MIRGLVHDLELFKKYCRFTRLCSVFTIATAECCGLWMPIVATEDGIVAKHNVVVLWAMKAAYCCLAQPESGVLFDMKWVIPLHKGISSV